MAEEKKPRKYRLKTLDDLRRYLARLINETEAGTIDPSVSGRLGYLCNILKSVISEAELEGRVAELERLIKEKK
ncbi:MAG: hypothetical protein WCA08_22180 [Desulfoferrobacter sp.]